MVKIEITENQALKAIQNCTPEQLLKISKRATLAGGGIIKKEAKQSLRDTVGKHKARGAAATLRFGGGLRKNKKGQVIGARTLEDKVMIKWHKSEAESKLNIMYPLLRWLDKGTKDRWGKKAASGRQNYRRPWREHVPTKPGYKGHEEATDFFGKAVRRTQDQAFDKIKEVIQLNLAAVWSLKQL
jgi:hypothetical protein